LSRPRDALAMLDLLATRHDTVTAWHRELSGTDHPLTATAALATDAVELARWIDALNPSQAYLIRRNRTRDEWLLAFTGEKQVDALVAAARELKGARLEVTREQLLALATGMADLRASLEALAASENTRVERVETAGGAEALLHDFATGGAIDPLPLP